jgi:hypothetical protein
MQTLNRSEVCRRWLSARPTEIEEQYCYSFGRSLCGKAALRYVPKVMECEHAIYDELMNKVASNGVDDREAEAHNTASSFRTFVTLNETCTSSHFLS